ncbi:MAG: response regulator [Rhodocyclaceae bacterium]|nr:response regulator [Rhodocyclaceae bacterium]MDZ4213459.1 response regulator [Rhodocyclaceae bacterium]
MENANELLKHRVMVLDDEQGIVNAVRRELSTPPLGKMNYEIETFTDPQAALARAREVEFEAVLSDYRMPQMTGLEFLTELGKIQPDCVRIVLSGQTDFDALVQMINETHIYRFIPKPWSSYFLKSTLSQAITFRRTTVENRKLAKQLRDNGIELPAGSVNEIDQVLVVDDSENVANAVARSLTRRSALDDVFREVHAESQGTRLPDLNPQRISVQVSDSPQHALKMADEVTFSCVIADYRMPVMDGAEFLTQFAEKQPDCACILFSGAANMESVVIALDLAHIHAFIPKPWNDYELRASVAQALARRRLMIENRILAQMCKARNL